MGGEVHALSSPGDSLESFARQTGAEVHAVTMSRHITPMSDLAALWGNPRVIRKVQPTIVHGHTPKGGLLAMMAATLCRVPVRIYHMYGLANVDRKGHEASHSCRHTERTSCRLAHVGLSASANRCATSPIAEGLCAADKIKVLNHGNIDGVEAGAKFNPMRVSARNGACRSRGVPRSTEPMRWSPGFVGRIVRDKGLIELVRAWQKLREEFASLHLLVAGPFESQDPVPADVEATLQASIRPSIWRASCQTCRAFIARSQICSSCRRIAKGSAPGLSRSERRWSCRS